MVEKGKEKIKIYKEMVVERNQYMLSWMRLQQTKL